ncbi:MAG: hypothetical protein ACYDGX_09550 [Thermoleophilia bacterium]
MASMADAGDTGLEGEEKNRTRKEGLKTITHIDDQVINGPGPAPPAAGQAGHRLAALLLAAVTAAGLVMSVVFPALAGAFTIQKSGDPPSEQMVISPTKVELNLNPGENATRDITLANRTSSVKDVQFSVEDFEGSQDPSQDTIFLGDKDGPFSARHWMDPEVSSITLQPGESIDFNVKINVPRDAEPGGHYAVLFASAKNDASQSQSGTVNLTERMGTLFLISVAGNVNEQGTLNAPEVPSFTEYGPINVGIVFNNQGNIHVKPHGKIYISNLLGQTVAELDVPPAEIPEWVVLPASSRRINIPWNSGFLFGRYTVRAEIEYGADNTKLVMTSTFWAFPWKIILMIVSALIIILILLAWATKGKRAARAAKRQAAEPVATAGAMAEELKQAPVEAAPEMAPAGQPPADEALAAPPAAPAASSTHVPLSEIFPSIQDNRMIDIGDEETRKLMRTMIDNQLDLARAYIAEGKTEEARLQLEEARNAAQRLSLLFEVGLIDDMLQWV